MHIRTRILSPFNTLAFSSYYDFIIPPPERYYNGACQLNDRQMCKQLNKICWNDYLDETIKLPFFTNDCLKAIAPICFNIWNNTDLTNLQCRDFVEHLNFTQMSIKPVFISAEYSSSNGGSILLKFNQAIQESQNYECSLAFDSNTLKWLPISRKCKKIDSKTIEVDYDSTKGIMEYITINSNSFYYDYKYSVVAANSSTVKIDYMQSDIEIGIAGLSSVSECNSINLFIVANKAILYPVSFKWNVEYIGDFQQNYKDEFDNYLEPFTITYSTNRTLIIPQKFLRKNSTLRVTAYAKAVNSNFTTVVSNMKEIRIYENIPKIKFAIKSKSILELKGDIKMSIPIQVDNAKCQETKYENENSFIIPLSITFIITSGNNPSEINTKSEQEQLIERNIKAEYSRFKALIVGNHAGFEYNRYYNITIVAKDIQTNLENSDTILILFVKPTIKSIIEISDNLASLKADFILNGLNSLIPIREYDTVNYQWSCIKTESISMGISCACPIFSETEKQSPILKIIKEKMTPLCKYKFSLAITAISKIRSIIRTAYNETEFYVHGEPDSTLKANILEYNSVTQKNTFLIVNQTYDNIDKEKSFYKWDLIEAENLNPYEPEYYSIKNSFVSDFLMNTLKINVNPDLSQDSINSSIILSKIISKMQESLLKNSDSRVFGLEKSKLLPDFKFTFAVSINQGNSSTFRFVDFISPPLSKSRIFSVSPSEGIGLKTIFTFTFTTELLSNDDEATYQFFRKDCINSDNSLLSEKMLMPNSYTMILAPGNQLCNFTVEIILRAFEYGRFTDFVTNVTVNEPEEPLELIMSSQINQLELNHEVTYDQKISLLSELSRIRIMEESDIAKSQLETLYGQISALDNNGGILDSLDNLTQSQLISIHTEILVNLIESHNSIIDAKLASDMNEKIESLLVRVDLKEGGTYIIPYALAALSKLADIGIAKQYKSAFFESIQKSILLMSEMKLNEIVIGSLPFSLKSSSISLFVEKSFVDEYENPKNLRTSHNISVNLPAGISRKFMQLLNTTDKSKIAIGAVICSTSFNPFINIHKNTEISFKSNFTQNSGPNLNNATIAKIYEDLKSANYEDDLNILKKQEFPIVQLLFKSFIFSNDQSESSSYLGIGRLFEDQLLEFEFPISTNLSLIVNDSLIMPLYFAPPQKTWTNENCTLGNINITSQNLSVTCKNIGQKGVSNVMDTFAITIDVIKDVYKVINHGNYHELLEVEAILNFSSRNIVAFCIIGVTYLIIIISIVYLNKMDQHDLYTARIQCLSRYFNKETKIVQTGILYEVLYFINKIKKHGAKNISMNIQHTIKPSDNLKTPRNLPTENQEFINYKVKNKHKKANGFSVLLKSEKTQIWDLYQMYVQCSKTYSTPEEIEEILSVELVQTVLVSRMTQFYIDDLIFQKPVTFCILLKYEHPLLSALLTPEITTPRPIKLLIFFCTLVGEFFVTGYFNGSNSVNFVTSSLLGESIIYSLAATALMIPLKIFISVFMTGTIITRDMNREQIEFNEKLNSVFKIIGIILGFIWLTGCLYAIMMYIITFDSEYVDGWMLTFGISVFLEIVWMAQLKLFVKVIVGMVLMKILKSKIMLSAAGFIATFIVEWIVKIL